MAGHNWNTELQRAIVGRWKLEEPVEQIYDQPPANIEYPAVIIGALRCEAWDTDQTLGAEFHVALEIHSKAVGRVEASLLAERVQAIYHRDEEPLNFILEGAQSDVRVMQMLHRMTHVDRHDDGERWVAVVTFDGLLQTS